MSECFLATRCVICKEQNRLIYKAYVVSIYAQLLTYLVAKMVQLSMWVYQVRQFLLPLSLVCARMRRYKICNDEEKLYDWL